MRAGWAAELQAAAKNRDVAAATATDYLLEGNLPNARFVAEKYARYAGKVNDLLAEAAADSLVREAESLLSEAS